MDRKLYITTLLIDWYDLGDDFDAVREDLIKFSEYLTVIEFSVVMDNIQNGFLGLYTDKYK